MSRRIFSLKSALMLGLALSLNAAPTPTPTPTPKRSFFSAFKPRVNPSATPARTGAAVGRGSHLGMDRSAQTPVPRPTPKSSPKPRSSSSAAHKSPTPTPSKAATFATPSSTPTPQSTPSPQKEISSEEELPPISVAQAESVSPTPTSSPTPTPSPTASTTPVSRPTKTELTLTKFEPAHGSPGDRDYRSARLSYRINVPNRMEFPTINFTVETSSGKLFERLFTLPAGSAFIEPGDNTERTVALDPVPRDDWADAYAKTDRATFNWSIEGQSSGSSEMPVKKAWP